MADRKLRVFLCHSSQDKPIVRELYQRLNAEGWIDPWLDEENLLPGQDWDFEIEKAVETADAVIVCLSNNSVTKEGYVQKEVRKVLDVADEKPETREGHPDQDRPANRAGSVHARNCLVADGKRGDGFELYRSIHQELHPYPIALFQDKHAQGGFRK